MSSFLSDAVADAPALLIRQALRAPTPLVALVRAGPPCPLPPAAVPRASNLLGASVSGGRVTLPAVAHRLGCALSPL